MSMLLAMAIVVLSLSCGWAQGPDDSIRVQRSTSRVKIEGKYYYIHVVRQGETLFSISRAYGVSQAEIARENPDIYLGLHPDQALKIPIESAPVEQGLRDDQYIYHVVARGETLFGLSRRYQVPLDELIRVNPGLEQGIQVSQVVLIPRRGVDVGGAAEGGPAERPGERFHLHEVRPQEGFLALRRQYGVSESTIRRFNPDLVKDGLRLGTVLRIPRNPADTLLLPGDAAARPAGAEPPGAFQQQAVVCDTFIYARHRPVFRVVLLLPFQAQEVEPAEGQQPEPRPAARPRQEPANNFLEFYQGVLLALDTLKSMGVSVDLRVFDTQNNPGRVKMLLRERSLQEAQLIIGPVFPETLKPAAEFAREHRIPIVSPLMSNNFLLDHNPYLFQVNPSFATQLEEFVRRIDPCGPQNLVIIHEPGGQHAGIAGDLRALLSQRLGQCPNPQQAHYKEVAFTPGGEIQANLERISLSLSLDRPNRIFAPSNNEVFVADLLGILHTLSTRHHYPISLYGLPRWQRFRNVQLDYYYQLQLQLFTPFFIDYTRPRVRAFVQDFREAFRAEPTQFAFQGFDVALYFISALKRFGLDFAHCIHLHRVDLLQSELALRRVAPNSGFENRAIHTLQYTPHYTIRRIPPPPAPAP